jgi:hypothetical protein
MRLVAFSLLVMLAGCGRPLPQPDAPLAIAISHEARGTVLTLHAHGGLKINALLPPQLELADGGVSRFGAPPGAVASPDSAYFSAPPLLVVSPGTNLAGALVRASVCDSGAAVCRVLTLSL